jgi:hypothetical protein
VSFKFDSNGEAVQVLNLHAEGGMLTSPKNDTRLLKVRAFDIGVPSCQFSAKEIG